MLKVYKFHFSFDDFFLENLISFRFVEINPNMITRKIECRKFVPNIFDKRKCSNCFRQREEHNAEALSEFNQVNMIQINDNSVSQ